MKINWKQFVIIFSVIYVFITLFVIYRLFRGAALSQRAYRTRETEEEHDKNEKLEKNLHKATRFFEKSRKARLDENIVTHTIEIWGKAAIGLYLWKHILNGELEDIEAGLTQQGSVKINHINFIFRSGPGIIQTTVPNNVEYLTLVLNGRSEDKIEAAKLWLDYLPLYSSLRKVAVLLLGNEQCDNDWILPYMRSRGGKIDIVFLVYDSPLIDNVEFYQWPLGVAVYRGFPNVMPEQVDLTSTRSYLCNFMGTVYKNSSRQTLIDILASLQDQCIVHGRKKWLPLETEDTLNSYIKSLLKSDLTLSPVGMNTECYRIYEAMSFGSVPLVEDVLTPGNCDKHSEKSPLRMLKAHGAPIMYIKDWRDLRHLLEAESHMTLEEKVERRVAIIEWYRSFKKTLADTFIKILEEKFF